jgi:DNA-binding response OmpR family regulator
MLPGIDGMQVCRLLRRDMQVPIIMLTALGGEGDRVAGLDTGADDYMPKPFGMRELMARIRALLRRSGPRADKDLGPSLVVSGDLEVDRERREVRRKGGVLRMKPKEFELLLFFVQHPGRVFSREQILDEVWGYDFYGGPARSMSTFAGCGRRSRLTRPTPSASGRCGAADTCSKANPR